MEPHIAWALLGLGLVIIELLSGTFYLLMLGIAAFGAAIAAYTGAGFPVQAIVAAAVSGAGCWGVHVWRAKDAKEQMPHIDAGQPARFETWIDEGGRLARVRYRDTQWDARVDGSGPLEPGAVLYITSTLGSTLAVTTQRPS